MEANEKPKQKDFRQIILSLISSALHEPYLPINLLVFLVLIVITDYAYVLMREPLVYWFDYSRESIRNIGGFQYGPLAALGVYMIYIAVIWAILRTLNRGISIIIWFGLLLWHLSAFIIFPPTCNYDTLRLFPAWLCYIHRDIVTFIIGSIVGLIFSKSLFHLEQTNKEVETQGKIQTKQRVSKLTFLLSVSWLIILGAGIGFASRIPTTGWRPIVTEHIPAPRHEMLVAYNSQMGKGILFGGSVEASKNNWTRVNDTWEWNGEDWTQLTPEDSPTPRGRGAMAYDPKRNVIVLFGGWNNLQKSLNDTWEWDGTNWKEVANCDTCPRPPARGCHNMYYDTAREKVVIHGGCNENQYFFNDAWGWDGTSWAWIDILDSPVASGAPIIYDVTNQWAVGFLAWQPSGTWIWDKNGWTKQALTIEPPLRGGSMMANDPATGNSLMFGGTAVNNGTTTYFIDTWMLNGKTWHEVKTDSWPRGRWGHGVFFDTKLNKFILFGGFDGSTALNDLWEISPSPDEK